MNALRHRSGRRFGRAALVGLLSLLASCGGGGDSPPSPPLPDLSGVWAGAWQGADPVLGQVGGTWEAEFAQTGTTLAGAVTLLGDVDCMTGQASGAIDAQNQLSGTLLRSPCQLNQWTLTALDVATLAGTGAWSQSGSGAAGSLSGQRVARLVGPRVRSVHPPAGGPGAVVTVAGSSLTPGATPVLRFGDLQQPALLSTSAARWVARVPAGAATGSVQLTTADGSAAGPVMFRTEVATPSLVLAWSLASTEQPAALVFSRDGRKLFVAEHGPAAGGIAVVHTLNRQQLTRTAIAGGVPIALATSPDGRRLFASVAGVGVLVLDGALATVVDTIPLSVGDAGFDNPQGLAVSPDGAYLLVSDGRVDGGATLLRVADKAVVQQWPAPAGSVLLGVAFSADGGQALVLAAPAAGGAGVLLRHDLASGAALAPVPVGRRPIGVAVSPDGRSAFVSNQADHTLSRIDLDSARVTHTPPSGGLAPTGIAFSPDGRHVLVANRDDATLSLHGEAEGWPVAPALSLGGSPLGVAIDPQGMAAFAGLGSARAIQAIGGVSGLNVLLGGTGFGSVVSAPAGIQCGTSCLARFPTGTTVRLTAVPGTNSAFVGWSGDAACNGGTVTLLADSTCVANFNSTVPPPQNVPAAGFGCFIATAAYGSPMAPQVQRLRDFRDRQLMTHAAGRAFVAFYYHHSPAWADAIRPYPAARAAVRALLMPIVFAVEHPAAAAGLALASIGLLGIALGRRRELRD